MRGGARKACSLEELGGVEDLEEFGGLEHLGGLKELGRVENLRGLKGLRTWRLGGFLGMQKRSFDEALKTTKNHW